MTLACAYLCKAPFTRHNLFSNRFDNRVNVCIHDTTGCQTGMTTGCIVYTNIQPGCLTRLTTGCIVYTAGCQTGCTTRFDNRLNEQWLFVQHGCQTVFVKPVVKNYVTELWNVSVL